MKRTHLLSISLGLLVLMLSSAWLGATLALRRAGLRPMAPEAIPPVAMLANHLDRLERAPDLTDQQRQALRPVVERMRREIRELARDSHERSIDIRRRLRAELETILTPSQRMEMFRRGIGRPRFMDRGRGGPFFSAPTNDNAPSENP